MHTELKLLYRFYSNNSSFKSSCEKTAAVGQEAIHRSFMELDFQNCQVDIYHIKSKRNSNMEVEVEVAGKLTNKGGKKRRFLQTWILVPKVNKKKTIKKCVYKMTEIKF